MKKNSSVVYTTHCTLVPGFHPQHHYKKMKIMFTLDAKISDWEGKRSCSVSLSVFYLFGCVQVSENMLSNIGFTDILYMLHFWL